MGHRGHGRQSWSNAGPATLSLKVQTKIHPVAAAACSSYRLIALAMTLSSTSDPSSIFEDGKLKPGIYKIQNLHTQQYADINEGSRKTCGRFATNLENRRGLVRPALLAVWGSRI